MERKTYAQGRILIVTTKDADKLSVYLDKQKFIGNIVQDYTIVNDELVHIKDKFRASRILINCGCESFVRLSKQQAIETVFASEASIITKEAYWEKKKQDKIFSQRNGIRVYYDKNNVVTKVNRLATIDDEGGNLFIPIACSDKLLLSAEKGDKIMFRESFDEFEVHQVYGISKSDRKEND